MLIFLSITLKKLNAGIKIKFYYQKYVTYSIDYINILINKREKTLNNKYKYFQISIWCCICIKKK